MIGSKSATSDIRRPRLAHDVHHPMQRTRVLHGNQAIAFEHEFGYPHQHGEKVVEQRRGIGAEKLAPYPYRCTESEPRSGVELPHHQIDYTALFYLHRLMCITSTSAYSSFSPLSHHPYF